MTKAKKPSEVIEIEGGQKLRNVGGVWVPENQAPELFDDSPGEDSADMLEPALQGVLTELGARDEQAKVSILRIVNQNGVRKEEYLFECHPSEFSMKDLQEWYGAGDYRVRVYGLQQGTNYKVVHANKRLSIGASPEQMKTGGKPAALAAAAPAPASDTGRAVAEALAPILASQAEMMRQLAGSGGNSRKDILAEMQMMATILKPAQGAAQENDPMKLLMLAKGLVEVMGGNKAEAIDVDEKSGPYAVLLKALETFGEMARNKKEGETVPALSAPAASHFPNGPLAVHPAAQPSEADMVSFALRMQLQMLLNAAESNADTETYSGLIYEQAPDDLIEKLQSETWFEELVKLEPKFAPLKPWCEKVRNEVLADLKGDEGEPAPQPASPAPDPSKSP